MLDKVLHNRWPRVGAALGGSLLLALAINLFIVPQHLYSSGLLGLCQVIRTLLDTKLGIRFDNFDLAGTLYLAANLPLLLLAYKTMGRSFVAMLALCTVSNSVFLSIIPIPATPIISDVLTSCLVGGILAGFSNGLVLTCGASCGGLDILGLYHCPKRPRASRWGGFRCCSTRCCMPCAWCCSVRPRPFIPPFTRCSTPCLWTGSISRISPPRCWSSRSSGIWSPSGSWGRKMDRGITYWSGHGAYTGDEVQILCICLSKYEIETLQQEVRKVDPHAFFMVQEGVHTLGNFKRHLNP